MDESNRKQKDNSDEFASTFEEWDLLSEFHKAQIMKGLKEADTGLGIPAKEVIQKVKEKYNL
ncbi:MAG TPA: hypothetical protein VGM63_05410 [Mucilaginibacter sp.]